MSQPQQFFDKSALLIFDSIPFSPLTITNKELQELTGLNGPSIERIISKGGDKFLVIEDQWNVYSRLKEDLSNIGEEL